MIWLKLASACLLVGAVGAVLLQKNAISKLHNANGALQQQQQEVARLISENERMADLRNENEEVALLMEANRDLPRLRNEVRQLREFKKEIEKLRLDNQQLATASVAAQPKPNALADAEGYVPAEKWTYGLRSPEETIQTWFLAAREGNWQQFHGALSPDQQKRFERQFRNKTDEERSRELKEGVGRIARISGFQVVTKEQPAEDAIVLGIRAAAGGEVMKIPLRRYGNEWKIIDGDPE